MAVLECCALSSPGDIIVMCLPRSMKAGIQFSSFIPTFKIKMTFKVKKKKMVTFFYDPTGGML